MSSRAFAPWRACSHAPKRLYVVEVKRNAFKSPVLYWQFRAVSSLACYRGNLCRDAATCLLCLGIVE